MGTTTGTTMATAAEGPMSLGLGLAKSRLNSREELVDEGGVLLVSDSNKRPVKAAELIQNVIPAAI